MKNQIKNATSSRAGIRVLAIGTLSAAILSSCQSSNPAPYVYVAPQKTVTAEPAKPVVAAKPKPKPAPSPAAAQARRFSLEEREKLEPVQAGGTGETLKTGIIKG